MTPTITAADQAVEIAGRLLGVALARWHAALDRLRIERAAWEEASADFQAAAQAAEAAHRAAAAEIALPALAPKARKVVRNEVAAGALSAPVTLPAARPVTAPAIGSAMSHRSINAYWTADAKGEIIGFSPPWLDLTGCSRDALRDNGWLQILHPEDLPAMITAWSRSVETAEPFAIEHRIRLAGGAYRWMRSCARPRCEADGRVVQWYGATEASQAR